MERRIETAERGDPRYFPDGRPKTSPDDTSMLGLSAVWSEMDAPLPPRGPGGEGRHAGGRAARRRAERAARAPRGLMIGMGAALFLVLAGGWVLISMFVG